MRVRLRQRERRAQVFPNLPLTLLDSGGGESSLLRRWTSLSLWTHIITSPVDIQHLYISVMLCCVWLLMLWCYTFMLHKVHSKMGWFSCSLGSSRSWQWHISFCHGLGLHVSAEHELGCKWNLFCNCIFVPKKWLNSGSIHVLLDELDLQIYWVNLLFMYFYTNIHALLELIVHKGAKKGLNSAYIHE